LGEGLISCAGLALVSHNHFHEPHGHVMTGVVQLMMMQMAPRGKGINYQWN
jgi:hypothetical protein